MQPQRALPNQDVVATVNGEPITRIELEAKVREQAQGQQGAPQPSQQRRKQALDTLVQSRLVEQYVIDKGPDVESDEIEAVIARVKQQLADQNVDFQQFLAAQGHTEKSFRKRIEGSIAWQKYQQQQMTEDKLQKFFEDNKALFQVEQFEEAQQEVIRTYVTALWQEIIRQMQPEAEIKIIESSTAPGAQVQPSPLPAPDSGR